MARMQTTSHDSYRFVLLSRWKGCPNAVRDKAVPLHVDHLDTRLLAPIGVGGKWSSHPVNEMMCKPGTGRGRRAAALIITQQAGNAQQRVPHNS